jgi:hypothetical protein
VNIFKFFKASRKERKIFLVTQGDHHHLEKILNRINTEYFEGKLDLKITWFNRRKSQPLRRIVLGSYYYKLRLIKINRYLDQSHIPDYFVAYIVYHEMLHHVFPPIQGKRGKRSIHHFQFKQQEKKFKEYVQALEFRKTMRKDLFSLS